MTTRQPTPGVHENFVAALTEEPDACPVCAEPFEADDICATDIELGTCHAACLEGSPIVDLETGEPLPEGSVSTYRYAELPTPLAEKQHQKWTPWQGGEMPVPEGTAVEVILRYGKQTWAIAGSGYATRWTHDSKHGPHDDIVFYRRATPAPESHVVGSEPVAWRVTRYDKNGSWLDTTLHIRKPEIASTSRTDIEPLYLGQEASTHD